MNARELVACAEAAMMTAKARGKNQIVVFDDGDAERPDDDERRARRPLDRAPEDAPEPRRAAEPAERRRARSARRSSTSSGC